MKNLRSIENELYAVQCGYVEEANPKKFWESILRNKSILKEAIKIEKDKNNKDTVKGQILADTLLTNIDDTDEEMYNELVSIIYSNRDIARIDNSPLNRNTTSFLVKTLWNKNLVLNSKQKEFAVKEAIDKDATHHRKGVYDIRYWILKNKNWTIEEKQQLVMDLFDNSDEYDKCLDNWEWEIIRMDADRLHSHNIILQKDQIYECSYELLLKVYGGNKKAATEMIEEKDFCLLMHKLRPQSWENGNIRLVLK